MGVASAIYELSDDAFQNSYELVFNDLSTIAGKIGATMPSSGQPGLRITELNKPQKGFETYEQHYKGLKITKRSNKTSSPGESTFSLRVDTNYEWYKFFEKWADFALQSKDGTVAPDTAADNIRSTVTVTPDQIGEPWIIQGFLPKTVPQISFSQEAGEPIIIEIEYIYLQISNLGEGLS